MLSIIVKGYVDEIGVGGAVGRRAGQGHMDDPRVIGDYMLKISHDTSRGTFADRDGLVVGYIEPRCPRGSPHFEMPPEAGIIYVYDVDVSILRRE